MADSSGAIDPGSKPDPAAVATRLVGQILTTAISGSGPFKGATAAAEEIRAASGDTESAVDRLVAVHLRLAAASGALTGLGGVATLPLTIPAGVGSFFVLAGRMAAGIAHLRGHDVHSDEVRTALLLTMVGAGTATEVLRETGVQLGRHGVAAAVNKVSTRTLNEINKKIGFKLLVKGSSSGVINLSKLVPLVGAPIGAATDVLSMRAVAAYARASFPQVERVDQPSPTDPPDHVVIDGQVIEIPPA